MAVLPKTRSVARRIHTLVLLVAALPLVLLAAVTYSIVLETLETKALREAHELARTAGMSTVDRLRTASNGLALLHDLSADPGAKTAVAGAVDDELTIRAWIRLAPGPPPGAETTLSSTERRQLIDQITAVENNVPSLLLLDGDPVRAFLAPATGRHATSVAVAEMDTDYLWDTLSYDGLSEQVCLLRDRDKVVFCNHGTAPPGHVDAASPGSAHGRPVVIVDARGDEWYAATWDLFLKADFHAPDLAVSVAVPERIALAPLHRFSHIFSGVSLIAILVALGIGSRLARTNLRPLAVLRKAIDGFASGNFAERATLTTGDDFQLIGDAFNDMADRIDEQFRHLEAISALQTELQKAHALDEALAHAGPVLAQLLSCDFALVAIEHWKAPPQVLSVCRQSHGAVRRVPVTDVELSSAPIEKTSANLLARRSYLRLISPGLVTSLADGGLEIISLSEEGNLAAEFVLRAPSPSDLEAAQRSVGILAVAMESLILDEKLRYQASHDWLTGLPNRAFLRTAFSEYALQCEETGRSLGMLMMDIDRFQQINEFLGHGRGDELLKMVASRMCKMLPDDCLISRFTGDTFVVLCPASEGELLTGRMGDIAAAIEHLLDEPYRISMRSVRLEGSVGGVLYPAHADSLETALHLLDITMREAKSSRRGGYLLFNETFRKNQIDRLDVEQALKGALANEELELYFQPVLEAASGQVLSAEALIRWHRPGVGTLGPDSFIEIAEASGLIGPIGEWTIVETCREIRRWIDAGLGFDTINVNVSGVQLRDEHFEQRVDHALAAARIPANTLTLEVTETALIDHFEEASERLRRLSARGVRVLIDDFGTGFASLKYLKMLPINGIKIDRLFVTELPDSKVDQSIVAAVVSLAQRSDFKLVAEGVETEAQARFLSDQGVPWLQGYFISEPIRATEMRARLAPIDDEALRLQQPSA